MSNGEGLKIVLMGAAGMSFGPVMVHDAIHSEGIRGAHLVMCDINERALSDCYAAAERLNTAAGEPIRISMTASPAEALEGANFVLTSVEKDRFKFWAQDYEIPVRFGSTQIMGENGGPGGMFHSLRSAKLMLSICRDIERYAPDAFLINLTNPMSRVCLAINRATKLRNVGLCHELWGGHIRIASMLMMPMDKIHVEASGINHFTFFYKIENAETGEDLYPKLRNHHKFFSFLYPKLVSFMFKEYGYMSTSTDSHIGEYVPFSKDVVGKHMIFNRFFSNEWHVRNILTMAYGKGYLPLPLHKLPRSGELAFPIVEGIWNKKRTYLNAINVPNKGYVPNLPDGAIVEVHGNTGDNGLEPLPVPAIHEPLAEFMRTQIEIQELVIQAIIEQDPNKAFESLLHDPLSPSDRVSCRKMFDQMMKLQEEFLPF